jgi:ketosteroid isomerase-like protein
VNKEEALAFADRFVAAIEAGDLEAVRAAYAPDARIWHNTDDAEQSVEENLRVLAWMARELPGRRYDIVRREALKDGFVQQHVLEAPLPDGTPWKMAACLVVKMADGRITRLDEYMDSAAVATLMAAVR